MTTNRLTTMLLGVALVLGMAGQAKAVSMTVEGKFADGGTLYGTMEIDFALRNPVTAWNLTTTAGTAGRSILLPGWTYNSGNSRVLVNAFDRTTTFAGISWLANTSLTLAGYEPTLDKGAESYAIGRITERGQLFGFRATRTGSGNGNLVNPEPATLLLFGTGLAGLGLWRYRKTVKS